MFEVMFRNKKRSGTNTVLIGRLPLRDVDFNESALPGSNGLGSHKAEPAESNHSKTKKPEENSISTSQISVQGRKRKESGNSTIKLAMGSNRTENSVVKQTLHTPRVNQSLFPSPAPNTNTPSCTYPSVQDHMITSSHKTETASQELGMTPSSTFPVSNPQSCVRTTTTPHGTQPPSPGSENPISHSKSVPKNLSSTVTHEDRGNPAPPPAGKPPVSQLPGRQGNPERKKTSSDSSLGNDAGIVVMNGQKFKKLCLLGSGGSSKVFKVLGENFQIFAMKEVYIKHVNPVVKAAYINEIKLLKRLSPRQEIITLHDYDYNKQEGVLYLLLEYAEMDLNAVIKKWNQTNHMLNVLYFWNQILLAVKVIHEEGVVHNDLKPANFVLIGAELKLIDFGISKGIEADQTSFERDMRCGTNNYMAPETIQTYEEKDFFKVGRPSDVWSLGCILYLMVYGRTPFEHIKNQIKKWVAIVTPSEPIPFPEIESKAAIDIMKKCLRRNPKERPTIDELIAHPFSRNTPLSL